MSLLAKVFRKTQRYKESESALRRAIELLQLMVNQSPGSIDYRDELALAMNSLVALYHQTGRSEASDVCRSILPIRRKLVEDFPSVPALRAELAKCLSNLSVLLNFAANPPQAVEQPISESIHLLESLVRDHPDLAENRILGPRTEHPG